MRIINQHGNASVELEQGIIVTSDEDIRYETYGHPKTTYLLGRYQNRERAKEVFDMIHNTSLSEALFKMPAE